VDVRPGCATGARRGNVGAYAALVTTEPTMTFVEDVTALVAVQPDSTVSRVALHATGARVVLFAFDTGQELTEHTAAVPALLQVLTGHLTVTAGGGTAAELRPGGLVHLGARLPHAVVAHEPSVLQLTMLQGAGG
jgi:quercetin dioxygenase-like cupin family protein